MMRFHKSLFAIFSLLCFFMAIPSTAGQFDGPPVLDTEGRPLQRDAEYFIKPAITDVAGNLTLITRKGDQCPFYVGQVPLFSQETGFGVSLAPYREGEDTIREGRDLKFVFQVFTICITGTQWKVGEADPKTGRRFVKLGYDNTATGYFRIDKSDLGVYNIGWCPSDVPIKGRPRCGSAGILIEKGVRFLALDGPAFPFEFVRVDPVEELGSILQEKK
ncbi:endogenous alpha-amylase/subtilisin inhibitor-like [Cucumis melo var. makuwa]|uniref:Endogenous alpha-amylase/subtilisin inhibitor-like n=1 Tax=Cucumis melo var. makuwa TaxID=1194695 RepID=A0A5A7V7Y2_CUCMM|nr:endogenous alpha-amylase/subtilisin inhibitor-like [Cucumis melo var. makuwa]TYK18339.1 endogenous alpha-amylase/subtilisin inhibitor-like [Cucumis melo var. makuwa]